MPFFTLQIAPGGRPLIDGAVLVSTSREAALRSAARNVPSPQKIRALVDTGASVSAVDPEILAALGLTTPTGQIDVITPSTGTVSIPFDSYDVRVAILAARAEDLHFISETVQVVSSKLKHQGFDVLLGTDVLSKCIFHYNGADNLFTIAY